jgi:ribosomal protein S18 acetylase RimI-like enzyme
MAVLELQLATSADISLLIEIEKSILNIKTYSSMVEGSEWQEALQKDIVYLIKNNRDIIGSLSYEKKSDTHVYISGLVIKPSFQNKGFGKQALIFLLEELKNIQRIDLVAHPDNHAALSLYLSLGFKIESRKENYYGDGEPRLVLILKRA